MGTWGITSFENDDAMDFVGDIIDQGLNPHFDVLERVANAPLDQYIEAPDCQVAIASAEMIAASCSHASSQIPEELRQWLSVFDMKIDKTLVNKALHAVRRIASSSELLDLWKENESEFKNWKASLEDLQQRLKLCDKAA